MIKKWLTTVEVKWIKRKREAEEKKKKKMIST